MHAEQPRDLPWGFLLSIGGLAVAGILLLVVPGMLVPGPAEPTPGPTPTPDPHVVVTDAGTIAFGLEDSAFVIRETRGTTVRELVRLTVATAEGPSGSPMVSGAAAYAMACGSPGSADYGRYFFGRADIRPSAASTEPTFVAPDGTGSIDSDGLFLFAVDPSVPDGETAVSISVAGQMVIGMGAKAFEDMATIGSLQPSGCFVVG